MIFSWHILAASRYLHFKSPFKLEEESLFLTDFDIFFPSNSLPKCFLNPSMFLARVIIPFCFENRGHLKKEFLLTGWCLSVSS